MTRRLIALSLLLLALLAGGVARAGDAPAVGPQRSGFTMELGIGGAVTFLFEQLSSFGRSFGSGGEPVDESSTYYRTRIYGGIAPLSFSIGGFVTENVALTFRASGTTYFRTEDPGATLFYGPALQIWASDRLMFGAGLGLGAWGKEIQDGVDALGIASTLRASYAFFTNQSQAVGVGLELVPGFYPDDQDITLGTAFILEWHLL